MKFRVKTLNPHKAKIAYVNTVTPRKRSDFTLRMQKDQPTENFWTNIRHVKQTFLNDLLKKQIVRSSVGLQSSFQHSTIQCYSCISFQSLGIQANLSIAELPYSAKHEDRSRGERDPYAVYSSHTVYLPFFRECLRNTLWLFGIFIT